MIHVYTGSNTTAPIGRIEDYNNTILHAALQSTELCPQIPTGSR